MRYNVIKTPRLDAAVKRIFKQLDALGGDLMKLPAVVRPVVILYEFHGMIGNGGFRYPLEGDWPNHPPYSIFSDAYRAVGAFRAADLWDDTVRRFPFSNPERDSHARLEYMASLDEDDCFFRNGDWVSGEDYYPILLMMEQYVDRYPEAFGEMIH